MITGYIRVSTGKQHPENQQDDITRYAKENGIIVNRWACSDSVSGAQLFKGEILAEYPCYKWGARRIRKWLMYRELCATDVRVIPGRAIETY